eukprot:1157497-Pelagomonas_calceolata.AAC.6
MEFYKQYTWVACWHPPAQMTMLSGINGCYLHPVITFWSRSMLYATQVGNLLATSAADDPANVAIYAVAFYLTTLGIIYVQEAERRIPINYSGR